MRGSTAGLRVSLKGQSPSHYALLSVLDSIYSIFILAPLVVGYWRAVWELMSLYVYPDELLYSALISIVLGFSGHLICGLYQFNFQTLFNPNHRRLTYLLVSRFYTIAFGFTCVNTWRGVWLLLDTYTEMELSTVGATTLVSCVALAFMRCIRNILAVPFCIVNDGVDGYFEVPTMFRIPNSQRNTPVYLLDCLFSVFVIGTLVVFVWRGAWVMLDLYLYPDDDASSAVGSLILGYVISIMAFLLQPLMRWACTITSGTNRIVLADLYLLFAFVGTVNVWRGIWNCLNLYYLPDEPELSCWSTHIMCLILLILLKCSNSILVRGVYIDAEEPAGKCVVFPCYYLRLYFQNERAKKHLKSLYMNVGGGGESGVDSDGTTLNITSAGVPLLMPIGSPIKQQSLDYKLKSTQLFSTTTTAATAANDQIQSTPPALLCSCHLTDTISNHISVSVPSLVKTDHNLDVSGDEIL